MRQVRILTKKNGQDETCPILRTSSCPDATSQLSLAVDDAVDKAVVDGLLAVEPVVALRVL